MAALLRRVAADGGFATVLRKGDQERGSILLFVTRRGAYIACLERVLDMSGAYQWHQVGPAESEGSDQISQFLARRTRFDEDLWAIELDVAEPERFIAETISAG